jgi:hypothetical protein
VSSQQESPSQAGGDPGRVTDLAGAAARARTLQPSGRQVFRMTGPVVVWWAWLVFAVFNIVGLAVQGRDHFSAAAAAVVAAFTGVAYACAQRPRIVTDDGGLTLVNPLRDHRVPWGRVTRVDLTDSVRVHCSPEAGDSREKVLSSWAVHSTPRRRLGANLRAQRSARELAKRSPVYGRLPEEAREAMKQTPAETMAAQLDQLAGQARERGAADGPIVTTWAWPSLAVIMLPLIALIVIVA